MHQKRGVAHQKRGLCIKKGASCVVHRAATSCRGVSQLALCTALSGGKRMPQITAAGSLGQGGGGKTTNNLCSVSSGVVALVCHAQAYLCSCHGTVVKNCGFQKKINLCHLSSGCWVEACSRAGGKAAIALRLLLLLVAAACCFCCCWWRVLLLLLASCCCCCWQWQPCYSCWWWQHCCIYVVGISGTTVVVDSGSTIVGVIGTALVSSPV